MRQATQTKEEILHEDFEMREESSCNAPSVIQQADPFGNSYITAQPVMVRRNEGKVLAQIKARARANGKLYYYSWEVKNKSGGKDLIEGGTIKLANDLGRLYGNDVIDTRAIDCGDHWMIYARFTDLETGFSMTRPYRQRKSQNVGKGFEKSGDSDRGLDMIMQIGTSKAIRNVIKNSISDIFEDAWKEAKIGFSEAIMKKLSADGGRESALEGLQASLKEIGVDLHRAEMYVGRKLTKWTVQDIVKLSATINSVMDNFINADDVFPPEGDAPKDADNRSELDQFEDGDKGKKPTPGKKAAEKPADKLATESTPGTTPDKPVVQVNQQQVEPAFLKKAREEAEAKAKGEQPSPDAAEPPAGDPNYVTPQPLDIGVYEIESVAGAKKAGDDLLKLLNACSTEDREPIFNESGGDDILAALSAQGLGMQAGKIRKAAGL